MAFRDLKADFDRLGYRIVGCSPDPVSHLRQFQEKQDLPFLLLSDEGSALAERLGIWIMKSMYGKSYMGIDRSTFVIGSDGTTQAVFHHVSPDGHAEDVLAALRNQ